MKYIGLAILIVLTGCSTGFNRAALERKIESSTDPNHYQVSVKQPSTKVTADDIRAARALKPQLKFPFRLAIYLEPSRSSKWRWRVKDKERIAALGEGLRKRGVVSDMFVLSDTVISSASRPAIRLAAAQHGADAVLIVKAAQDLDRYVNPSSILYATLAGYYLVPGSHADVLMMAKATMWDVGNDYLYLGAEAEGEASKIAPGAFLKNEDVINTAKSEMLDHLEDELLDRLSAL